MTNLNSSLTTPTSPSSSPDLVGLWVGLGLVGLLGLELGLVGVVNF